MIFRLTGACSLDDCLADVASGTTTQIVSADATVTTARIANSPRQPPLQSNSSSAGKVALNAPRAPSMTIQPFMAATRAFGNQDDRFESPSERRCDSEPDESAAQNERRKSLRQAEQHGATRCEQQQRAFDPSASLAIEPYSDSQF